MSDIQKKIRDRILSSDFKGTTVEAVRVEIERLVKIDKKRSKTEKPKKEK